MQIQEKLTEKAGIQNILLVSIALNLHKDDGQVSGVGGGYQDAVNPEAGLLDFLRGKAIRDISCRRSTDQVKDDIGVGLKDLVEKAVGFQASAVLSFISTPSNCRWGNVRPDCTPCQSGRDDALCAPLL